MKAKANLKRQSANISLIVVQSVSEDRSRSRTSVNGIIILSEGFTLVRYYTGQEMTSWRLLGPEPPSFDVAGGRSRLAGAACLTT